MNPHHSIRMLYRRIAVVLPLAIACTSVSSAGGPVFSRYGIGDLVLFGSNRANGMNLMGFALTGSDFINRINPASLAGIRVTRFSGSGEYRYSGSKDASGASEFSRGEFLGLAIAVPISVDNGIVISGDLTPYSKVRYAVDAFDPLSPYPVKQTLYGEGGVWTLGAGISYSIADWMNLGAKLNYHFGRTRQISVVSFDDPSFINSEIHHSQFYRGVTLSFGTTITGFDKLFGSPGLEPLTAGLVVTTPERLSTKDIRVVYTDVSFDTTREVSGLTDLPLSVGLGFSYLLNNRYVLSTEFYTQLWEDSNFFGGPPVDTRNSLYASLGFEARPSRDAMGFFESVYYRAGLQYGASYVSINGLPVNVVSLSAGASFPLGPGARLNLDFKAGRRGEISGQMMREDFVRLTVSISASEEWFIDLRED